MKIRKLKKREKPFFEIAGFVLLDLSIFLAYRYHYKHFYELLILGIFLIFYALDQKYILTPNYARMYTRFIKAGIIGDLVLGLSLTRFWRYNYNSIFDYASLYLIVYPVAGIVMVQSFIFLKSKFVKREKRTYILTPRIYRLTALVFTSIIILLMREIFQGRSTPIIMGSFFLFVCMYAILNLNFTATFRKKLNLPGELHDHPIILLMVLVAATYFNAFLHELPNIKAQQWTYQNYPWPDLQFLGIPAVAFVAWPILMLFPLGVYYILPQSMKTKKSK